MTTIALFGATGKVGRRVLQKALDAGYSVRALVRDPDKVTVTSNRLTVLKGDVLDAAAVRETIAGTDAVVSVFGQVKGSPPTVQTDGTRNIVAAMDDADISRLISLSGGGLRDSHDRPKTADRVIRTLLKLLSGQVLADAEGHLEVLRASDLDWTVVRGPRLLETPGRGTYRVGWVGVNASTKISYDDIADFIVKQIDDTTFVRQLPFVSE